MTTFGYNFLQNRRDNGALMPNVERLRSRWHVVMDDHVLAVLLRQRGYGIIERFHHPSDARFHETMTAAEMIASYASLVREHGTVLQVLNEPVVNTVADVEKLTRWLIEVMRLAKIAGIRLCVANFSMGNPHESLIDSGAFDNLIRAIAANGHILGLHEYAKNGELQITWLIGRYRRWLNRARIIGVNDLEIVLTEVGFDVGGGRGDGYRAHIESKSYAAILHAMGTFYATDKIAACVYSYGDGFGWEKFNIEGDSVVMDELVKANAAAATSKVSSPPLDFAWGAMRAVWITPYAEPVGSIVRQAPDKDAERLTKLLVETRVNMSANTWQNPDDSLHWHRVILPGGMTGYIASMAILSQRVAGSTQELPQVPTPVPDAPVEVPPVVVPPDPTEPESGPIIPPVTIPLPEDNAALRNNILAAFREIEINAAESARNQQAISDAAASLRKLLASTWNIELAA